jgi:HPt (histidine-containing phosphotransfer) domain-containing protein
MNQDNSFTLPLVDASVLDRLRAELDGDEGIWRVFIQDFLAQLPVRTARLLQALTSGDAAGAMDAVLSLRTSSQMVGAERLAHQALTLETALRAARDADPGHVLPQLAATYTRRIKRCADQTGQVLKTHLAGRPGRP